MKEISMSSNEEALTKIVELVSGFTRQTIRSKNREHKIAIARSILGSMLREEGCSATRAGVLVGRHHASVLKYTKDHKWNLKYYPKYKDMYLAVQDEYATGYRAAKIDHMQEQIDVMQKSIRTLKMNTTKLINK
tara:strand:+ start:906 stop:1307 length:402 start_codon:yes stop_codon:yes gene_type:complete